MRSGLLRPGLQFLKPLKPFKFLSPGGEFKAPQAWPSPFKGLKGFKRSEPWGALRTPQAEPSTLKSFASFNSFKGFKGFKRFKSSEHWDCAQGS